MWTLTTGAISGTAIARRASFLLDRLEEQLFDSSVVIAEVPHRPRGLRSRQVPVTLEGLSAVRPPAPVVVVPGNKLRAYRQAVLSYEQRQGNRRPWRRAPG